MVTAKQIVAMGFSGKRVGEILKILNKCSPEEVEEFLNTGEVPKNPGSVKLTPGTVWWWLCHHPCVIGIKSASNSEKRRWLETSAVIINGTALKADDPMPDTVESLVFFPNSQLRITML